MSDTQIIGQSIDPATQKPSRTKTYDIEAVRYHDHVQIRVFDGVQTVQIIVALPFSGRFSYISFTGAHCSLSDMSVDISDQTVDEHYIPRICEEVSYIRDCPVGDIPNIQIEGHRAKYTQGIPVTGDMKLSFHVQALPNARIIWHCPYLSVFTSDNGMVDGDNFREYVMIRLDGEELEDNVLTLNGDTFTLTEDFKGWDAWKDGLKEGIDCEIDIRYDGSIFDLTTENLGIAAHSVTAIPSDHGELYIALTGDQCAITNIRIR